MLKLNEIEYSINSIYRDLHANLSCPHKGKVILSHFGNLNMEMSNNLSEGFESFLQKKNYSTRTVKRMFTIMLEGLQNICLHGEKTNDGKLQGHIVITEKSNHLSVSFGNLIHISIQKKIAYYLDQLNNMTPFQLKNLYLNTLSNSIHTQNKTAGLGFIVIALKSNSKIKYRFIDYKDELNYFELGVNLDTVYKQQKNKGSL